MTRIGICTTLEFISLYGILGLQRKEATVMGSLRFTAIQTRPTEVLDLTSLTVEEFQQLVPPFEAAFQAHMAGWRLDGQPRTARRYTTYQNCPLPTPADRLGLAAPPLVRRGQPRRPRLSQCAWPIPPRIGSGHPPTRVGSPVGLLTRRESTGGPCSGPSQTAAPAQPEGDRSSGRPG